MLRGKLQGGDLKGRPEGYFRDYVGGQTPNSSNLRGLPEEEGSYIS